MRQNADGSWSIAEPIGPQGWVAKLERWLRERGHHNLAHRLGAFDERNLGK